MLRLPCILIHQRRLLNYLAHLQRLYSPLEPLPESFLSMATFCPLAGLWRCLKPHLIHGDFLVLQLVYGHFLVLQLVLGDFLVLQPFYWDSLSVHLSFGSLWRAAITLSKSFLSPRQLSIASNESCLNLSSSAPSPKLYNKYNSLQLNQNFLPYHKTEKQIGYQ